MQHGPGRRREQHGPGERGGRGRQGGGGPTTGPGPVRTPSLPGAAGGGVGGGVGGGLATPGAAGGAGFARITTPVRAPVGTPRMRLVTRRLARNPGAVLGGVMLAAVVLFALAGNAGNPYAYDQQDLLNLGSPPGTAGHRLGTDAGGFDLWAMLVRGTGRSLLVALVVGLVTPLLAAVYGTAIAVRGGTVERVGVWVLDMMLVLPSFLVVAVLMGSTGGGALHLALALTAFGWAGLARVVRASAASLRERDYVRAARYLGVSDREIVLRHIVPNLGSYLVVTVVLTTFGAIVAETTLSFLGVGVRPPDVSLGRLIGDSASQLAAYPWLFWGPTITLQWLTIALALVGDGVRDALDPTSGSGGRA